MASFGKNLIQRRLFERVLKRWHATAEGSQKMSLAALRQERHKAHLLRTHLNRVIQVADERLATPINASRAFAKPHNADWAWRPDLWRAPLSIVGAGAISSPFKLDDHVSLFHDCPISEMSLRHLRNNSDDFIASHCLRLSVYAFDGSFLSLVINLPEDCITGMNKTHIIRLDMRVKTEAPLAIYARLNVRHGPNTEQIVRQVPLTDSSVTVEFDLAYSDLNEKQVESAWIDLIVEDPNMNEVTFHDLTVSRRPRAEL
ncbi:MAG: DUF6478 family protein [Pseudomonadota bacterium]